jgi:hypothetical protein
MFIVLMAAYICSLAKFGKVVPPAYRACRCQRATTTLYGRSAPNFSLPGPVGPLSHFLEPVLADCGLAGLASEIDKADTRT